MYRACKVLYLSKQGVACHALFHGVGGHLCPPTPWAPVPTNTVEQSCRAARTMWADAHMAYSPHLGAIPQQRGERRDGAKCADLRKRDEEARPQVDILDASHDAVAQLRGKHKPSVPLWPWRLSHPHFSMITRNNASLPATAQRI
eukprot:354266-Chlamydomonas_euryale.AAC.16